MDCCKSYLRRDGWLLLQLAAGTRELAAVGRFGEFPPRKDWRRPSVNKPSKSGGLDDRLLQKRKHFHS